VGPFPDNCAPVLVVVRTPRAAGWIVGTVQGAVATGVGATVGVGIVDGAAVGPSGMVGTAVATTGDAILGGAMTGPDGAVTPCVLAASVVLPLPPSSPPDSSLFGVPQLRDGPETDVSGSRALHVPPFASQEAGFPICAVLLGHM
jgi:hypothetical protein